MSSPAWRLRSYRRGDENEIASLFERGYGRWREPEEWLWKYRPAISELDNVWLAVDSADRPVFHYGGIGRRLDLAGTSRQSVIAFDAVTDPHFRRLGIFSAAMEKAHAVWKSSDIACILGLPNEQWGSRVTAFDWRELFPLRWQIRILRPEAVLAKRAGFDFLRRLTPLASLASMAWPRCRDSTLDLTVEVPGGNEIAELWQECRERGKRGLARDQGWLEARFLESPGQDYRVLVARRGANLAGYLVFRFDAENRYGYVAEMLTLPDDRAARRVLLGEVIASLGREGAVAVASLAVPGTELQASLRRCGFLFSWGAFTVRCVPLASDLDLEAMRDAASWWLCGGDFDVI